VRARSPHVLREEGSTQSLVVTPGERLGQTYASLPRRELDVDIGSFPTFDETFVVKLGPGHTVLSLPKPEQLDTPFGRYSVEVNADSAEVRVHSTLALKVSRVSPKSYADFRRFCQQVDAAFEQRLVLGTHTR